MTTDNRIESLETQVRTLKRMLFGVFGVVIVGGLLAATTLQSVPDVIRAKKFEVVNDAGKVIVQMDSVLHQETHYGFVRTLNSKGGTLVALGVSTEGTGSVTTENGKGGTLVALGVSTGGGGEGLVTTGNGKGGTLVELGATVNGEGMVTTGNGKGGTLVGTRCKHGWGRFGCNRERQRWDTCGTRCNHEWDWFG